MAGQSASLPLSKARSLAKGAGCELGVNSGGAKNSAPTEGKTLGDSKGKSASAGDSRGKGSRTKASHNY